MSLPLPASTAPPPDPNVSVPIPSAPIPAGSLPLAAGPSSSAVGVTTNEQLTAAVLDLGKMMAGVHAFLLGPQPGVAPPPRGRSCRRRPTRSSGCLRPPRAPSTPTGCRRIAPRTPPRQHRRFPPAALPSRTSSFPPRRPRSHRGSPTSHRRCTPPRRRVRRSIRPLTSHRASAMGAFRRRVRSMEALTAQSSTAPLAGPRRLQPQRSAGLPRLPLLRRSARRFSSLEPTRSTSRRTTARLTR
jgi:hypothetical protein